MTDHPIRTADAADQRRARTSLYRAVWRWHFFAGLFVLPFLITLSVTGALYLFRDEIDAIVHADLKRVAVQEATAPMPPSALMAAALTAHPGTAAKITLPATPDSSAEVTVDTLSGERLAVYVNPYDAAVLGSLPDRGTIMWTVRTLHSLKYFGPVARGLIEIAAGWSILLVLTGAYLWWPRGQSGGVVTLRGKPAQRIFWRDLHAVLGLVLGGFIAFLAITGMPWSGVWGAKVNEWANGSNFGYPSGVRVNVPMSDARMAQDGPTTWSLEQARVPLAEGGASMEPIGIDDAVSVFDGLGLHKGYTVVFPKGPTGVFSASVYPDDLAQQRVVHLNAYSGKPLIDMSYGDYGPLGRWLEFGINVHLGQEFGLANKLVLLAVCIGNVVLAVAAGAMWWKRRPKGAMGVPPLPAERGRLAGVAALMAVGGLAFPLVGLSFLVMLALDLLVSRGWRHRHAGMAARA